VLVDKAPDEWYRLDTDTQYLAGSHGVGGTLPDPWVMVHDANDNHVPLAYDRDNLDPNAIVAFYPPHDGTYWLSAGDEYGRTGTFLTGIKVWDLDAQIAAIPFP
jgi:hypothetical protein